MTRAFDRRLTKLEEREAHRSNSVYSVLVPSGSREEMERYEAHWMVDHPEQETVFIRIVPPA